MIANIHLKCYAYILIVGCSLTCINIACAQTQQTSSSKIPGVNSEYQVSNKVSLKFMAALSTNDWSEVHELGNATAYGATPGAQQLRKFISEVAYIPEEDKRSLISAVDVWASKYAIINRASLRESFNNSNIFSSVKMKGLEAYLPAIRERYETAFVVQYNDWLKDHAGELPTATNQLSMKEKAEIAAENLLSQIEAQIAQQEYAAKPWWKKITD